MASSVNKKKHRDANAELSALETPQNTKRNAPLDRRIRPMPKRRRKKNLLAVIRALFLVKEVRVMALCAVCVCAILITVVSAVSLSSSEASEKADTQTGSVTEGGTDTTLSENAVLSPVTPDKNALGGKMSVPSETASADDTSADTESAEVKEEQLYQVTVTFYYRDDLTATTPKTTLGEFLSENGVTLNAAQQENLYLDGVIDEDMTLSADVVSYADRTEEYEIGFDTQYRSTYDLPEGESRYIQQGVNGTQVKKYSVCYVNGEEIGSEVIEDYVSSYPTDAIVETGVAEKTFIDSNGVARRYSYYIDVLATCYHTGGYTATGLPADEGVIAVDPSVIPLGSYVYVTGDYGDFGERIAADTGGNIVGNKIDVCLSPDNPYAYGFGWRSMRVYFLE